jgi:hypothetical protein
MHAPVLVLARKDMYVAMAIKLALEIVAIFTATERALELTVFVLTVLGRR